MAKWNVFKSKGSAEPVEAIPTIIITRAQSEVRTNDENRMTSTSSLPSSSLGLELKFISDHLRRRFVIQVFSIVLVITDYPLTSHITYTIQSNWLFNSGSVVGDVELRSFIQVFTWISSICCAWWVDGHYCDCRWMHSVHFNDRFGDAASHIALEFHCAGHFHDFRRLFGRNEYAVHSVNGGNFHTKYKKPPTFALNSGSIQSQVIQYISMPSAAVGILILLATQTSCDFNMCHSLMVVVPTLFVGISLLWVFPVFDREYFFLCVLSGLSAVLIVIYLIRKLQLNHFVTTEMPNPLATSDQFLFQMTPKWWWTDCVGVKWQQMNTFSVCVCCIWIWRSFPSTYSGFASTAPVISECRDRIVYLNLNTIQFLKWNHLGPERFHRKSNSFGA